MHFRTSKIKRLTRAFTLVEMIVALGIFSIVAVVALGALVKIISANKKAQTLQASITNLSFALDSMSRELRVGSKYYCEKNPSFGYIGDSLPSKDCSGGTDPSASNPAQSVSGSSVVIAFKSSKIATDNGGCNLAIAYMFDPVVGTDSWKLKKAVQKDCITGITIDDFSDVIDPGVFITGYYLDVVPTTYPSVVIRISGYAGVREKEKTVFDVQTTVSARTLE